MNRISKGIGACTALAFAVFIVSCDDGPTTLPEAAQETAAPEAAPAPLFDSHIGTAAALTCMGDESVGFVQGTKDAYDLNCTANDVVIALADINNCVGCSGGTGTPADPYRCVAGSTIQISGSVDLQSNSQKTRSDIGWWIATKGGDGISGECQHFYFDTTGNPTGLDDLDVVSDACGDIGAKDFFAGIPLDKPVTLFSVVCQDTDGDDLLDAGACTGWKVPGDDQICPNDAAGDGNPPGDLDFVKGTLPANKAKCRCDKLNFPIAIDLTASLEVKKVTDPTTDDGKFDLQIDEVTDSDANDVGNGGSTGKETVGAGDSQNPGANHKVGEVAGTGTSLSDYDSDIKCVDRGLTTFNGGSPLTATGAGPLTVPVDPDDDIVCTITNVRKGKIVVAKETLPDGNTTQTFNFDGPDSFDPALKDGQKDSLVVSPGTYTVAETVPTGWDLTALTCSDGNSSGSTSTKTATYKVEAGERVVCTFTNTKRGTVKIKKLTEPTGGTGFGFTDDIASPNSFSLDHNQTKTFTNVLPGTYTATENDPTPSYDLKSVTCDDGSSANPSTGDKSTRKATVKVDPGETVTCTFTNTKRGTIKIKKITDPTGGTGFSYTDNVASPNSFSLDHGQTKTFNNVVPGTYWSTEGDPAPTWALTALTCDDGSSANPSTGNVSTRTATVKLDPGETVTCTFTNTEVEVCELGDRVTSVTLEVTALTSSPIVLGVHEKKGQAVSNVDITLVAGTPLAAATVGTEFTVDPLGSATHFTTQNLRFSVNGVESKQLKVHLSCSDDPYVGQTHIGDGVTLTKTAFTTDPKP